MRVMRRLNPDKQFSLSINRPDWCWRWTARTSRKRSGNLLENAARYAQDRISLNVEPAPERCARKGAGPQWIVLQIDERRTGGSTPIRSVGDETRQALDEASPETGLGLSIVSEMG